MLYYNCSGGHSMNTQNGNSQTVVVITKSQLLDNLYQNQLTTFLHTLSSSMWNTKRTYHYNFVKMSTATKTAARASRLLRRLCITSSLIKHILHEAKIHPWGCSKSKPHSKVVSRTEMAWQLVPVQTVIWIQCKNAWCHHRHHVIMVNSLSHTSIEYWISECDFFSC